MLLSEALLARTSADIAESEPDILIDGPFPKFNSPFFPSSYVIIFGSCYSEADRISKLRVLDVQIVEVKGYPQPFMASGNPLFSMAAGIHDWYVREQRDQGIFEPDRMFEM